MANVQNMCNLIGQEERNIVRNLLSVPLLYYRETCLWWPAASLKKILSAIITRPLYRCFRKKSKMVNYQCMRMTKVVDIRNRGPFTTINFTSDALELIINLPVL